MKTYAIKLLLILIFGIIGSNSIILALTAPENRSLDLKNFYTTSKKSSKQGGRSSNSKGQYFNATYQWICPDDTDEYTEIEFKKNGKCIITEDIVTDLITCEVKYVVKGNTIQIIWGKGKTETLKLEGNTLIRNGKRFYRL